MSLPFEIATGTVQGRDHRLTGRNAQDALCVQRDSASLIAVVCDGCGSGPHSEVGAKLGARLIVAGLRRRLNETPSVGIELALTAVRLEVLGALAQLARGLEGELAQVISDYLLFTVVGVAITRDEGAVFRIGDGVTVLDEVVESTRYANDTPPYLSYALLPDIAARFPATELELSPRRFFDPADVGSIVIGTDGLDALAPSELLALARDRALFANPWSLQRHLERSNRERRRIDWDARCVHRSAGSFADDVAAVLVRRTDAGRP